MPSPTPEPQDDPPAFYGISRAEWAAIERDVRRGAARFWAKRGLEVPDEGQPWDKGNLTQRMYWAYRSGGRAGEQAKQEDL